jgi:hypothetical protein
MQREEALNRFEQSVREQQSSTSNGDAMTAPVEAWPRLDRTRAGPGRSHWCVYYNGRSLSELPTSRTDFQN